MVFLSISPIGIWIMLAGGGETRLEATNFRSKYGSLYLGVRKDKFGTQSYTFYFLLRRLVYVLTIAFLSSYPGI